MKKNHTPGPWKIDESMEYTICVVAPWSNKVKAGNTPLFGDYRGGKVCEMHYNSGVSTKEQAIANAKLIAAAPELLECCDAVLTAWHSKMSNMHKKEPAYLQQIRDAIKKATE